MERIKRIRTLISKIFGVVYVLYKSLILDRTFVNNKRILIILTGHIGNIILDAEAIYNLYNWYINNNYEVFFITSQPNKKVLLRMFDFEKVSFICENYHYKGNGTKFKEVREVLDEVGKYSFDKIIVTLPECDTVSWYIVAAVSHNEAWTVFGEFKHAKFSMRSYFENKFDKRIMVNPDTNEMQRLKKLLRELIDEDWKCAIHYLPPKIDYHPIREDYITITIDSAITERRWDISNFIELIDELKKRYSYSIILTGGKLEEDVEKKIYELYSSDKRVHNFCGKTTFEEWIEIIRGALFHIGVDSGSIHVAAAVGTQSFCLTGVWDGKRVMPYVIDVDNDNTRIPLCVYRRDCDINKMSCYGCKAIGRKFGYNNKNCKAECKKGKPCECLQRIQMCDVIAIIEEYEKSKGKNN